MQFRAERLEWLIVDCVRSGIYFRVRSVGPDLLVVGNEIIISFTIPPYQKTDSYFAIVKYSFWVHIAKL